VFYTLSNPLLTISCPSRVTGPSYNPPNVSAEVRTYRRSARILATVKAGKFHRHLKFQDISRGPHNFLVTSTRAFLDHTETQDIHVSASNVEVNRLNPELNPICNLLSLLAHHFLHVSRI